MNTRKWSFLVMALVVALVCVRLGIWQLARLQQRRQQNETIRVGLAQPAIDLNASLLANDLSAYQRVTVTGQFDADQEILLSPRALNGQPGVHLVTPLHLDQTTQAILVDRGWIPFEDRNLPERTQYQVDGTVTITGYLRAGGESSSLFFIAEQEGEFQPEWQTLDIAAIQNQVDLPLINWVLVQEDKLADDIPQPVPQAEIDLSEGPHLGYAFQWFSFAAIGFVGAGYWLWRQRNPA